MSTQNSEVSSDPSISETLTDEGLWERKDEIEIRNQIIEKYIPMVWKIVRSLQLPEQVIRDDLFQEGVMAVMSAVERFKPEKEVKFESFAFFAVRGRMIDHLREMDYIPRLSRKRIEKRLQGIRELTQVLGYRPSEEEICSRYGESIEKLLQPLIFDPQIKLHIPNPTDLEEVYKSLNREEQTIMYLYYEKDATMKAIAYVLGLSESRVSQRHSMIIDHLKERFHGRVEVIV